MATIAAIAAIGSLLGGGAAVASAAGANNRTQQNQSGTAREELNLAKQNVTYQQLLNALATKRSTAGYEDSFGSTLGYDPYTNKWTSQLGALPQAADTSALLETIRKNTTDAAQQRFANERAATRAASAEPVADRAVRDFSSYQPVSANVLSGLLTRQAADANSTAYRDVLADTLRSYARSSTAGAPVIADIGEKSAKSLSDAMVKARISGIQGADELNKSRLSTLGNTATTASALANPSFQATPFQTSNRGDTLANMESAQQRTASFAPVYGGSNINAALGATNTASNSAISSEPDSNFGLNKIGQLGSTLSSLTNKDSNVMKGLSALFGGSSTSSPTSKSSALTSWTDPTFNAWNWSTTGT